MSSDWLNIKSKIMEIKNVTVPGTGVLHSQITLQSAFTQLKVSAYDRSDEEIEKEKERIDVLKEHYQEDNYGIKKEVDDTYNPTTFYTDLEKAEENADLVIAAFPKVLSIKQELCKKMLKIEYKNANLLIYYFHKARITLIWRLISNSKMRITLTN
jgi:3-hydroxyacyl-CoA dehydrogenase